MKKSIYKKRSFPVLISAFIIMLVSACTGNINQSSQETSQADSIKNQHTDSVMLKLSDRDTIFVIAGQALDRFKLNEEVEQAQLFSILGEADSADAAMCKSWSMWYLDKKAPKKEIDVYAVCDANVDMRKTIQIIRLKNVDFTTEKGISAASTLSQLKAAYPEAESTEYTEASSSAKITLLDDAVSGITFEIENDQITSVAVHKPGEKITNTYLPFYNEKVISITD